jgi:hypothetical protein
MGVVKLFENYDENNLRNKQSTKHCFGISVIMK